MTRHGKANASSVGEGSSCTGASDSATLATTQQSGESQAEGNTAFVGQAVEQIKPWLSRLGQAKPRSRKPSLKLVRSSLQNLETSSLNQMHSSNMHPLSMKSRPSLLNRMNMETELLTPHTERVRMSLVTEVSDMKHLTGIMPEPLTQSMSTTSLVGYPRESHPSWETMIPEIEVVPTKSKGFTNPRCHGSVMKNVSGNQLRTSAATRPETSSTSSKETMPLSRDGSGAPLVPQQGSPVHSGMHSSKGKLSTSIPSSVLSSTSIVLTKASDVLGLLRSSLEDQNLR